MIASTHTHAGPVTITTFFNPDGSADSHYMRMLAMGIEEAVNNAWRDRLPARVGVGVGRVEGVGVNRRSNDQKPIDEQIGIIRVTDLNDKTHAVLINYACHPTVLGPDNLSPEIFLRLPCRHSRIQLDRMVLRCSSMERRATSAWVIRRN